MFQNLQDSLGAAIRKLRGTGAISEGNISDVTREIRMALLAADVHLDVVRDLIARIREKSLGADVLKSLSPEQQFVKIVHDELVAILGDAGKIPEASAPPTVWMMVGLQGSGKTTSAAKLARYYAAERGKHPFLIPADTHRPAAIDQLLTLAKQLDIPALTPEPKESPDSIVTRGLAAAKKIGADLILIDTAGRLAIDEAMMAEAERLKKIAGPHALIYVADAMTGQSALETAKTFNARLGISGMILSKLDGDARGGAALSIRHVLGKPLFFVGTGEKPDALELFHPDRLASRLLGMGDVVSLVENVQRHIDADEAEKAAENFKKGRFTLLEFRDQLKQIKKLGPLNKLIGMLPGVPAGALDNANLDGSELTRIEAIINAMTPKERADHTVINGSRRKRIAKGAGVEVMHVNQLLRQFAQMQKMMKMMGGGKGGMKGGMMKGGKPSSGFKDKMRALMQRQGR
jgi:signal recognition particle subunit SRP54